MSLKHFHVAPIPTEKWHRRRWRRWRFVSWRTPSTHNTEDDHG